MAFRQIVGEGFVISDKETQKPYECDGLSMYCEESMLVVLPGTVDQLKEVIRLCRIHEVPVVTRGAGTGLSAGAMPAPDGIVLSTARLNKIIAIDEKARTARVQPGVRNISISEAAGRYGLYYAPDPSSQIACSIGGNVAENSGGVHCLKYGLTVHNVQKAELILVDGTEITLGGDGLDGIIPAGLEMMDRYAISAAEDFCSAGYPKDAEALLLCEIDGSESEVHEHCARVAELFKTHAATSIRISASEEERTLLWKGRKSAFPAVGRISPDYYCMDGTIPRSKLAAVLTAMSEMSDHFGLRVANVFHAGDGNLHPLILFDNSVPGEFERAEAFGASILELCVSVGGCITGEHGVGMEKIRQMPIQFSDSEIALFHELKHCFDPAGLLNPGKGVPLLKHCQEYRAARQFA
ncbi:MAG: FAD-binding protein [Gammaproteobacteria bacterium]|nr:FAD-binding protein [Gammaproteobacteria bacterium]